MRSFQSMLSLVLTALLLVLGTVGVLPAQPAKASTGTVYYVDSVNGSDSNNGTSTGTPWKTLAKVNGVAFQPGDQILFKSGSVLTGTLMPQGSGTAGNPIIFDKYGTGPAPIIDGNGSERAVYLLNLQHITLRNLEIVNDGPTQARRSGIYVIAQGDVGRLYGITLENLDIHNIKGLSNLDGRPGRFDNSAIYVAAWEGGTGTTLPSFGDLRIEGNYIHDVTTGGIYFNGTAQHAAQGANGTFTDWYTNVVIRNNTVNKTGTDGIVNAYSIHPIIEHNVVYDAGINDPINKYIAGMWSWGAKDVVWQYNEVARVHFVNKGETDSVAFDTDIISYGTHIYQYNYTHENAGGFIMSMGQLKGENIIRYNISQNDGHNHFTDNSIMLNDKSLVHNNVFYNDTADGFRVGNNSNVTYMNNIFYSKVALGYPERPLFDSNAYLNAPAPSDRHAVVGDPQFADAGKGVDGIHTVGGYKLKSTSPLVGAGRVIADNGGQDFWGNALYAGSPDIGAFEGPGSAVHDTTPPAKPTELVVADQTDTSLTLNWTAVENGAPLDGEVYDAATDAKLASVMSGSKATLTGLEPDTSYSFYVVSKDLSGNISPKSDTITVKTTFEAVVVDNTAATVTGTWTARTDATAYNTDYVTLAKGTGANSVTWTPDLPQDGYYSVYYRLPNGSSSRASNAPFTVAFDGGTKTYAVNERPAGGSWVLLGIHKFKAGTTGYVKVTDQANGEVSADAVKFLYNDGLSLDSVHDVVLSTEKLQLRIGSTMGLKLMGKDAWGKGLDLAAEGLPVQFVSDSGAVSISDSGIITGVSQGTAHITATVTVGGTVFTSNSVEVIVGHGFTVAAPSITDYTGNSITTLESFGYVQATTKAVNSTDRQQSVTLIVALYNDQGLVKSSVQSVVIKSYENATLNANLILPEDVSGAYLKVFVWDSKDTLRPLAATTILQD